MRIDIEKKLTDARDVASYLCNIRNRLHVLSEFLKQTDTDFGEERMIL